MNTPQPTGNTAQLRYFFWHWPASRSTGTTTLDASRCQKLWAIRRGLEDDCCRKLTGQGKRARQAPSVNRSCPRSCARTDAHFNTRAHDGRYAQRTAVLRLCAYLQSARRAGQHGAKKAQLQDTKHQVLTEVLSAQTALSDARLERIRCLAEWRSASLRLLANVGGL